MKPGKLVWTSIVLITCMFVLGVNGCKDKES